MHPASGSTSRVDVRGLHVSMQHPVLVAVGQAGEDLPCHVESERGVQSAAAEDGIERGALEQLHHEVGSLLGDPEIEDLDQVRMRQGVHRLGFAQKTSARSVSGPGIADALEGHRGSAAAPGSKHLAAAAFAQPTLDPVAVDDGADFDPITHDPRR